MVKRRWVWVALGLVAVAAALLAALLRVPSGPPYNFQDGADEIEFGKTPFEGHGMVLNLVEPTRAFTIRAEYVQLRARAEPELNSRGLLETNRRPMYYTNEFISGDGRVVVRFHEDCKAVGRFGKWNLGGEGQTLQLKREPGWVTVTVEGEPETSWFGRLRSWLGL